MTTVPRNPEADLRSTYGDCRRCGLHKHRRHVVIGRGSVPADVLFIGIGPGKGEDLTGTAFFGPAGRMLNKAIEQAEAMNDDGHVRAYMTNVVGCRPCNGPSAENRDPRPVEALACRPRLLDTVALVQPQRVILLGQYVQGELRSFYRDGVKMYHPAYLAREGINSPQFRRFVVQLADVYAVLTEERG